MSKSLGIDWQNLGTLACVPLLAACVMTPNPSVTVRHVASTESAGNGARWHLFLFDPAQPRDIDTRIALAKRNLQPGCAWVGAPKSEIIAQTNSQGARYGDTTLAAPLICKG